MKKIIDTMIEMGYEPFECSWEWWEDCNKIAVYGPHKCEMWVIDLEKH